MGLLLLIAALAWGQEPAGIVGFRADSGRVQRAFEEKLLQLPQASNAERHHRFLTEDPHVAGTPGARRVVDYIARQFRAAGIETSIAEYDVLLSYPERVSLTLTAPEERQLANREIGYPEDKDSFDPRVDPPWHAYSASGDVTAQVIYVNYGRAEDYRTLDELGVDYRGKIGLARYFKGYRGGKSLEAEQRGLSGLIIYSDPAEDGYARGDIYPKGPWGPESHVQRGANVYDFRVPGDPLTPGWASTPGARRIPESESTVLPKIPTIPISYADATEIFHHLGGPAVPQGWQGGLPFAYHTGPGPAEVRMNMRITRERRPIYNVIGRIEGREEPEKVIVLSNHHDAWVYGAVDPSSGTATLIELARVFGELKKTGWSPRRTIILGCWDAEEYTLTGSTEWGEEHAEELRRHGVACLNVDSSVAGPNFAASAVPSLRRFIVDVVGDIPDPRGGSVLDRWIKSGSGGNIRGYGVGVESELPVEIAILGSGSDYTVFFNFLGMPSVDMLFDGAYGVYHSQYDSHHWMKKFGDPGFHYNQTMVALWGVMATRLADADLLPFDYVEYARDLRRYSEDLQVLAGDQLDLTGLDSSITALEAAARDSTSRIQSLLRLEPAPEAQRLKSINEALLQVERDLTHSSGLPGRPWFKHLIYAPLPSYEAETFPGVREAVVEKEWSRALRQRDVLVAAIDRAAATLRAIE